MPVNDTPKLIRGDVALMNEFNR